MFDEAVRLRLHGDGPVGAYLSSGVDSCSVVDAMARHGSGDVKAFTLRFEDPQLDEIPNRRPGGHQLPVWTITLWM